VTAPARTVFFGSGAFAVPTLEALAGSPDVELIGIVSTPDRPAGRGAELSATPVARRARELGLPLLQPERLRDPGSAAVIADLRPELGVLADYGKIVPTAILDLPSLGILNVHPSLLPRWRGATPIPAAIAAGDTETGVSLIRMDAGLDTGPIVAVERLALDGTETTPGLEAQAALVGAGLVLRTLEPWISGALSPRPQDDAVATLTRPLRRADGLIDPRRSAVDLERQVRAYQPWPGSFLETGAGRLVVLTAEATDGRSGDRVGSLVADGSGLAVVVSSGRLRLIDVQPAGGRRMTAAELLRGRPGILRPSADVAWENPTR
jgi:methionyl-tRNA formyltransferase